MFKGMGWALLVMISEFLVALGLVYLGGLMVDHFVSWVMGIRI